MKIKIRGSTKLIFIFAKPSGRGTKILFTAQASRERPPRKLEPFLWLALRLKAYSI